MPGTPTTKYSIPTFAAGGTDPVNTGHTQINSALTTIDGAMAGYATGTFAGKPAAGKAGRLYLCTDTGQWLADTGTVWVDLNTAPALVTSLPGSPFDGQEIYFSADPANGVVWRFRYRSASASTYKWEFVGGGPITSEINAAESITSAGFVNLTTPGPFNTVPLAGNYEITYGAARIQSNSAGNASPQMAIKIGSAAVDINNDIIFASAGAGTVQISVPASKTVRRTVPVAVSDVMVQYGSGSPPGQVTFSGRFLSILPIRVG